jgi:hypothetical protein
VIFGVDTGLRCDVQRCSQIFGGAASRWAWPRRSSRRRPRPPQIEANKVVQRGLYALWTEHPGLRPGERPDLGGEVRPRLDRITTEIVRELKATQEVRAAAGCRELLADSRLSAEVRFRLDALHRRALTIALWPVCACASG